MSNFIELLPEFIKQIETLFIFILFFLYIIIKILCKIKGYKFNFLNPLNDIINFLDIIQNEQKINQKVIYITILSLNFIVLFSLLWVFIYHVSMFNRK